MSILLAFLIPGLTPGHSTAAIAPIVRSRANACPTMDAMMSPVSDTTFVVAAAALVGAAGFLQYSLSSGEQGINAFLMKEKSQNPFYSKDFKPIRPEAPRWMRGLRLPRFSFVEVYGESGASSGSSLLDFSDLDALYSQLDAAIEREDYDTAAAIKARIDEQSMPS